MHQRGFSLTEIVVVVALLSIFAGVMAPSYTPARLSQLNLAANETLNALSFARQQAMHHRSAYGVEFTSNPPSLSVFRLDSSVIPPVLDFNVYHPLTKNLYTVQLQQQLAKTETLAVNNSYIGDCNSSNTIAFDENGLPFCTNPYGVFIVDSRIDLVLDNYQSSVQINAGRIFITP